MGNKISKQYKRRLIIFGSISVFVIICFIYSLVSYIASINNLKKEEANLKEELAELEATDEDLRNTIEKLKDPDYLAKYARENYLYSKDGEYVIRINENSEMVIEMNTKDVELKQKLVYVFGFTFLIMIIYVIIKKRRNRR